MPKVENLLANIKPKSDIKLQEPIPNPFENAFRFCAIGATLSGKTMMLMNCLLKWWVIRETTVWDDIFIFASSAGQDDLWSLLESQQSQRLKIMERVFISKELEQDRINMLLNRPNKNKKTLVWIDDMAGDKKMLDTPIIHDLFYKGRQNNISVLLTSQHYYQIPPSLRVNASHLAIFNIASQKTLAMVKQDLETRDVSADKLMLMFDACTREKFSFMFVQMNPRKWFKSFDYEIEIPSDGNEQQQEEDQPQQEEDEDSLADQEYANL